LVGWETFPLEALPGIGLRVGAGRWPAASYLQANSLVLKGRLAWRDGAGLRGTP